jgi:hypothetical protein
MACRGESAPRGETSAPRPPTESPGTPTEPLSGADAPAALDSDTLMAAWRALRPYAAKGNSVLEIRATPKRVVLQCRLGESSTLAEYAYDGRVIGPVPTHVAGTGELEKNLFDLGALDWNALVQLLPAAPPTVDPLDGRVTELVVRRYLPFSEDVRARLYVWSPRMSGHLDADARGQILEK